jgi:hypothetical protein
MEKKVDRSSFPSFWISPEVNLFDTPINKIIAKAKHKRCNSGKVSPYEDQSSLLRLKTALKTITRKQSPINSSKVKRSSNKSTSFKLPKPKKSEKLKKKKTLKKKPRMSEEKLKVLNKNQCKKAPKIFSNQIFSDIYDSHGNHDRVLDTLEVSNSRTRILQDSVGYDAKFIIASNLETELKDYGEKEAKQPDNSFLAETKKDIRCNHFELFQKLTCLAAQRENERVE